MPTWTPPGLRRLVDSLRGRTTPIAATMPGASDQRSGRNMGTATVVGFLMLGAMVGAAYFSPPLFAVLVYGLCVAAYPEWKRALARQGRLIALTPIVLATIGIGFSTWHLEREGLVIALLVGCAGAIAWRLVELWVENTLHDALATILTLVWIPFFASFVVLMLQAEDGFARVVVFVGAVVCNDTGALLVGMAMGRTPMAPRISPKKTWEGAVGGGVLGVGAAAGLALLLMDGDWKVGVIVGVATVVAAVLGDLVESALKRDIDIKDMSQAIPGHGGVLDRLDSVLLAAPVAFTAFAALVGTQ